MDADKKIKKEFRFQVFENEVIIEPLSGKHELTIIWLHHLYRNAADLSIFFMHGVSLELEVSSLSIYLFLTHNPFSERQNRPPSGSGESYLS